MFAVYPTAGESRGVPADRAVIESRRAVVVVQPAAVERGVSAEGAVGERHRASVGQSAAGAAGGDPVRHRQTREGRGGTIDHLKVTGSAPAADRHARRRARDRQPAVSDRQWTTKDSDRLWRARRRSGRK